MCVTHMGAAARDDIAIAHQILTQTNKLTIRHVINFVKLICKLLWDGINHILKCNLLFRVCVCTVHWSSHLRATGHVQWFELFLGQQHKCVGL